MLLLLSLLTSILDSFANLINKKTANKINDIGFVWLISLCSLPFFVLGYFVFGSNKPLNIDLNLITILITGIGVLIGARLLLRKAYDCGDMSLVAPMTGFTPIFSLLIGLFILNEIPSTFGYIGILLIFLGSMISNFNSFSGVGFSFKKIFKLRGVYLTILSDVFYSVYFLVNKLGSEQAGIFPWLIMLHGSIAAILLLAQLFTRNITIKVLKPAIKVMSVYALFNAFSIVISLFIVSQMYLVYFTSLMQIYILVDVFLGHFVLKENDFIKRIAGSTVIFVGLIMIGIFG
jgi:drug/metabolite transporter (DMT)-like permease